MARTLIAILVIGTACAQDDQDTKKQIEELNKRVSELEKGMTQQQGHSSDKITAEFKDGLRLKSESGDFEMHIGGRYIHNWRFVTDTPKSPGTFLNKEARLECDGLFYKMFEFKIQGDFGEGTAQLQDAYVGLKGGDEFNIRIGQCKEPFWQEEFTSRRFIDFDQRSFMSKLAPGRDIGTMVFGKPFGGYLKYEFGIFNGQGKNSADANDQKEIAARFTLYPLSGSDGAFKKVHVAISGTRSLQSAAFASITNPETNTAMVTMNANVTQNGKRDRKGIELLIPVGPFALSGEYGIVDMTLLHTPSGAESDVEFKGGYVAATYLLTGETKEYATRVRPTNPFNIREGKWGAFELAARYSTFNVDDTLVDRGFAAAATTTRKATAYTIGINWWLIANVRLTFDYVSVSYTDELSIGSKQIDSEKAYLARFQVDF